MNRSRMYVVQEAFKRIDENRWFQGCVILVILISALAVGAHTYELDPFAQKILNILDDFVTIFFILEIIIRYIAVGNAKQFFSKAWNLFDIVIVLGSLYPDAGSTVLIARLLRIFRVLRLVSILPELRVLINALFKSIPQMAYIALLMFVIFYIYAAVGSMLFSKINPVLWGDVAISMLTLFRVATFEDWTDVMYEIMLVHPLSWLYFLSFIFLTAFIFLNMMVGAVLEVMSEEHNLVRDQRKEKEDSLQKALSSKRDKDTERLIEKLDQLQQRLDALETSKKSPD